MKNSNISQLDPNQMSQLEHDALNDAKRVILVGGEKLDISIDSDKIANAIKESLTNISLGIASIPPKEENLEGGLNIIEIEKQVFIPQLEIRTIEIPVIVKEYQIIEKPIFIEKIVTVEKPVIVKEIEIKEIIVKEAPKWVSLLVIGQLLFNLGILLSHLK